MDAVGNMFDYATCGTISPNFFFGRLAMGGPDRAESGSPPIRKHDLLRV